jgi:hypothetical protein
MIVILLFLPKGIVPAVTQLMSRLSIMTTSRQATNNATAEPSNPGTMPKVKT